MKLVEGLVYEVYGLSAAENAAEDHSHRAPEAIVDEIQNDECEDEYPKNIDHHFQEIKQQPQDQQAGDKSSNGIFSQIVHF
jgi:hypothetical protein